MRADHRFDGVKWLNGNEGDFIRLCPSIYGSNQSYSRCEIVILVSRDFRYVFVGGGEHGFDGRAREADLIEIEALAERFKFPELRMVIEKLAPSYHP